MNKDFSRAAPDPKAPTMGERIAANVRNAAAIAALSMTPQGRQVVDIKDRWEQVLQRLASSTPDATRKILEDEARVLGRTTSRPAIEHLIRLVNSYNESGAMPSVAPELLPCCFGHRIDGHRAGCRRTT